jgi:hypothetical protein
MTPKSGAVNGTITGILLMMLNDLKSRAKFSDKGVMGIYIIFDYFLNSPNGRWSR